jgi:FKBP-type peptidyl-prolyl cis-trans isomerase
MHVGGKRTLLIPPNLGYGARGVGKLVPPHAPLVFDIELVSVH